MHAEPSIAVIIPTRDRAHILGETLRRHLEQADETGGEIIVVDDGSRDVTPEVISHLEKSSPRLIHVRTDGCGPAAARNRGIERAKASLILFTGDDMRPGEGLLRGHIEAQRRCGGAAVVGHVSWDPACRPTALMRVMAPNGPLFNYRKLRARRGSPARFFYTANLSIPVRLLAEERFDERFEQAAFEDVDLGARLTARGVDLVYEETLLVHHHHRMTARQLSERLITMRTGRALLQRLHPELALSRGGRCADSVTRAVLRILGSCERAG